MYENKFACPFCCGELSEDSSEMNGKCKVCGREVFIPKSDIKRINRINYFRNTSKSNKD